MINDCPSCETRLVPHNRLEGVMICPKDWSKYRPIDKNTIARVDRSNNIIEYLEIIN